MIPTSTTITVEGTPSAVSDVEIEYQTNTDGTISILTSPALRQRLQDIANLVPACAVKLRTRQTTSCGLSGFMDQVFADPSLVSALSAGLPSKPMLSASDISAIISTMSNPVNAAAAGAIVAAAAVLWDALPASSGNSSSSNIPNDIPPVIDVNPIDADQAGSATTSADPRCPSGDPVCLQKAPVLFWALGNLVSMFAKTRIASANQVQRRTKCVLL